MREQDRTDACGDRRSRRRCPATDGRFAARFELAGCVVRLIGYRTRHSTRTERFGAAVANLAATTSSSSIVLTWAGSPGATYVLARKTYCGTDSYVTIATLSNASFTDTTVQPYWVYWYIVTASDPAGHQTSAAIAAQAASASILACSGSSPQASGVDPSVCQTSPDAAPADAPPADASAVDTGPAPLMGGTPVACQNTPSDAALVQNALNTDASVSLSGTCDLGTTTLTIGSNVILYGPATLSYQGSGYALASSGNGNTVDSLTFIGGGLELSLNSGQAGQSGWTITNNHFQNITSGSNGINIDNIIGKGPPSTISNNTFTNIWSGGYPNFPSNATQDSLPGTGIYWNQGIDNTTLDSNSFDEISFDAIKGFNDGFSGNTNPYMSHGVVISNNVMTRVHRMGIETMGGGSNCPGGCNFSVLTSTGMIVKSNYFHNPVFQQGVFGYSVALDVDGIFMNNAAIVEIATCLWPLGTGVEHELSGGTFQGNVIGAIQQDCTGGYNPTYGWASYICPGYTIAGYTTTYQNNIACGDKAVNETASTNDDPLVGATIDEKYDYWANVCPAAGSNLASSAITLSFTSSDNQASHLRRERDPGVRLRSAIFR